MKFSLATVVAAAAFLPLIHAHLIMTNPGTFIGGDPMPPLQADGSDFPCTVLGDGGEGEDYEPGSSQSIRLTGTAVHSGGSCQISFTYDNPPNKNSVWKVAKSFHGSCPVDAAGNLDSSLGATNPLPPLDFVVPEDLPSGPAVVAWTWFNKSGNREMYMRCAKVNIGGSNSDQSAFDSLPDMFVANIGNGCTVPEGADIAFPNPGSVVAGSASGAPTGSCGASGGGAPPPEEAPEEAPEEVPEEFPEEVPEEFPEEVPEEISEDAPEDTVSTSCVNGSIVCESSTEWALCEGGVAVSMGAVPPGTTCSNGSFTKRSVRFSSEHLKFRRIRV